MEKRNMSLTTERLKLRPFRDTDRDRCVAVLRDPRVSATYMLPDFASDAEAEALFLRLKAMSENPDRFMYAICREDRLVGFVNEVHAGGDTMELGYVIAPSEWNQGYATEALGAAISELFRMGYKAVRAGYFEGNLASCRVMEKCGMAATGETETVSYRGAERLVHVREVHRSDADMDTEV